MGRCISLTLLFFLFLPAAKFDPLAWHFPREQSDFLAGRVAAIMDTNGKFLGSGFFACLDERPRWIYLVSNAHVIDKNKHLLACQNGASFDAYLLTEDQLHDVTVMAIEVKDSTSLPPALPVSGFAVDRTELWPGMVTFSAAYPLGVGFSISGSPALSFGRIAQLDGPDSLIRLEGMLDLGSSGAPVFTWLERDKGHEPHLIGMARSFNVAHTLSEVAGDTLVIHSALYEVVPASFIYNTLKVADSLVMAYTLNRRKTE